MLSNVRDEQVTSRFLLLNNLEASGDEPVHLGFDLKFILLKVRGKSTQVLIEDLLGLGELVTIHVDDAATTYCSRCQILK
jgi:hypothetical protein